MDDGVDSVDDKIDTRVRCKVCKIMFVPKQHTKGLYCDQRCKSFSQRTRKKVNCDSCGKELLRHKSELKSTKHSFCNRKCQADFTKIDPLEVISLRSQGLSFRKIGTVLGIGRNKADYVYKRYTVPIDNS